jgi:protein TonB
MKKLSSFGVSVIVHGVILAGIFFAYLSYKHFQKENKKQKESYICIQAQQVVNQLPKKLPPSKTQTKQEIQQHVKKEKKLKKSTISKNIKKIQKPKHKTIKPKITKKKIIKKSPKQKKEHIPKPHTPPAKKNIENSHPIPALPPQKKQTTPPPPINTPTPSFQDSPIPQQTYTQSYIDKNIEKIRELIAQNIYYPRKARRRHIEGKVILRFRLTTDGVIKDVTVVSSEHDVLSYAAKQILILIEDKVPKPKEDITLTLPIIYKLK